MATDEQKMQAVVAEYNALRTEIQYRSDFQHRILQLHITTLTLIIGVALSQSFGSLIILSLPIEACIFGMLWRDQSYSIDQISSYIRYNIEIKINSLLDNYEAMRWETKHRELYKDKVKNMLLQQGIYSNLTDIIFGYVSLGVIIISFITLLFSQYNFNNFLNKLGVPISIIYAGMQWWLALIFIIVDILFYFAYRNSKAPSSSQQNNTQLLNSLLITSQRNNK